MKIFEIFNALSSPVKGLLGIAAIFSAFAGYVVISSVTDSPRKESVYKIENSIDQSLLPELEDEKPKEKLIPKKVINIPNRDTFKPKVSQKKPVKKKPVKKKNARKKRKTHVPTPKRQVISKPTPIDHRIALRRKFNMKRRSFSSVSYTFSTDTQSDMSDKNKQDDWPVDKDSNTYPTDLSRVVTKEKFISAILNNRIESTFAGKILLTIDHNVYGSHGNRILIPIGTKASGSYAPVEEIGVERLSMSIERMVTPDGQLILFKNPATIGDQQGAAGVKGDIDNKYLQKFGLPLAFSVANNATNILFQKLVEGATDPDDEESALSQVFNEQWSKDQSTTNREIISDIIKSNINIMPTITIEPGQKLLLFLDHDIWFKPNKNGSSTTVESVNLNLSGNS